eukprot:s5635_g2.t2
MLPSSFTCDGPRRDLLSRSWGCTGMAVRFLRDEVLLEHDPTIEDLHSKELVLKGTPVCLEIVDTAGQETYTSLRKRILTSCGLDGADMCCAQELAPERQGKNCKKALMSATDLPLFLLISLLDCFHLLVPHYQGYCYDCDLLPFTLILVFV